MRHIIRRSTAGTTLPQIGQFWRHIGQDTVFMRISDRDGSKAISNPGRNSFFSVNIATGSIAQTGYSSNNFEILQPIGGEPLELELA